MGQLWSLLLSFGVYLGLALLIRRGMSRIWLPAWDVGRVRRLVNKSWVWACFVAPICCLAVTGCGRAGLSIVAGFFGFEFWQLREIVPFWTFSFLQIALYVGLCASYDWWMAKRCLSPRDGVERKRIGLWILTSNLLWLMCFLGILTFWVLWLLSGADFDFPTPS